MPKRPAKWRILALLPDWLYYGREIERGLLEFAARHAEVTLVHASNTATPAREVRSARPDGIVAFVDSAATAAYLARQKLPVVHVAAYRRADARRSVVSDDTAVGRTAAEYLRSRGFVHFAYVGPSGWHFAERRRAAFVDDLRDHGREALVYDADDLPPFAVDGGECQIHLGAASDRALAGTAKSRHSPIIEVCLLPGLIVRSKKPSGCSVRREVACSDALFARPRTLRFRGWRWSSPPSGLAALELTDFTPCSPQR